MKNHIYYYPEIRYWKVMNYLASNSFNAEIMCRVFCLQHKVNETLDNHIQGKLDIDNSGKKEPIHATSI
tara:strand:+ start:92 stop:298 length:207 start_codon:yes stop_codon:yes gene_type:complete